MEDISQLILSIFFGLIFSFIIAKLISMAIHTTTNSNSNNDTRVSNQDQDSSITTTAATTTTTTTSNPKSVERRTVHEEEKKESVVADKDEDDDWEGVEYTELDEIFSAATAFVAASAADRLSAKVSNENQLKLYGFYKIATEGPCKAPQPSTFNVSARAKWNAWQRLGSMSPEEAMQMYIELVCELFPSWAAGSASTRKDGDRDATNSASKGMMGPVFSSFVYEEDSHNEATLEAIHDCAREGEIDNLRKYIGNGVSVNLKDSEGRTPLHWAVDRGHANIVELLLNNHADVNAKDNEGQTPLHYAAMCDREDIAELLVKRNADRDVKDNEGNSASDLCETNPSWMQS